MPPHASDDPPAMPPPILPPGTQVVTLTTVRPASGAPPHVRGMTGVVVASPAEASGAYRVRFTGGAEADLSRDQIEVLSRFQSDGWPDPAHGGYDYWQHVQLKCVIGSRAYGLDDDGSDTDRRGFYLPPAELHWSLGGVPGQLENDATQETYWEAGKFASLALRGNPNVLECLYTPLVDHATPVARELLDVREAFLSKTVYQTYSGYALSQFKKMQADVRIGGAPAWKHVMHLLRLLISGAAVLRDRAVTVHVGPHRDRLLAVRRGEVPLAEVEAWRASLHAALDDAYATTTLPERPDFSAVNAWLIRARRGAA